MSRFVKMFSNEISKVAEREGYPAYDSNEREQFPGYSAENISNKNVLSDNKLTAPIANSLSNTWITLTRRTK